MYSQRALGYFPTVTPRDEQLGALAHARRCVIKACELRPKLPYGFQVAAQLFLISRMHGASYTYAEKV